RGSRAIEQISRNAQYGFIINPLSAMDDATFLKHVEDFHEKKKLKEVVDFKTFERGARLAVSRRELEKYHPDTMTDKEKMELDSEDAGELRSLTKALRVLLFTCAIGAVVHQESIVGANIQWPEALHIANTGDIVGSPQWNYFSHKAMVTRVPAHTRNRHGRKGFCLWSLIQARVPVIESEVAPPKLRGRLLVSWQTFVAVGIFLGASANLIFHGHWRLQIGMAFIPAVPLLCLCYVVPEYVWKTPLLLYPNTDSYRSPRWLMRKKQYRKAYLGLLQLRATPLQAAHIFLVYVQSHVEALLFAGEEVTTDVLSERLDHDLENDLAPASKFHELCSRVYEFFSNIFGLFRDGRNRRAVVASGVVMIAQHKYLCLSRNHCPSRIKANKHSLDGIWVIPFMYSSEIFPQKYREVGMSLAVAINLSFAGALAMAVPQYQHRLDGATRDNQQHLKLLGSFAILDFVAAILVWLFMRYPEKAVELEDMNVLGQNEAVPLNIGKRTT
ncbi:unnamed protein product, partial [Aureobasidium vineae]